MAKKYTGIRMPDETIELLRAWKPVATHVRRENTSLADTIEFLAKAAAQVYPELAPKVDSAL